MKLEMKNLLVILLITNLSSPILSKVSSSNSLNSSEKNEIKNNISSTNKNKSNIENSNSSITKEKTEQVLVNSVRTHHYEEAEEAPPGSIASRVIPNQPVIIHRPIQLQVAPVFPAIINVALPRPVPRLITANEWSIPFPVVRPVPVAPIIINRPLLGSPPGPVNIGFANSPGVKVINVSGVPPMPVTILKPGVTRVMHFPVTGSSFNTNFEGNIDSFDDLKISSNFFLIY
jgi:hypothetical protein